MSYQQSCSANLPCDNSVLLTCPSVAGQCDCPAASTTNKCDCPNG